MPRDMHLDPDRVTYLDGDNNPRGTIVAACNDRGEPFVGIVDHGWTVNVRGEDVWAVVEPGGDAEAIDAGDCCIVDTDRVDELYAHLGAPAGALLSPAERVLAREGLTALLGMWASSREAFGDLIPPLAHAEKIQALVERLK